MGEQTSGLFSSPGVEAALEVTPHPICLGVVSGGEVAAFCPGRDLLSLKI